MSSFDGRNVSINLKHEKKATEVFIESGKQDGAEEEEELEIERWTDDCECMWLSSSDSKSSSLSFNEDTSSWDVFITDSQGFVAITRVMISSLNAKKISGFDGSIINPIEQSSLVLDRTLKSSIVGWKDDLKEEEIVSWLLNSSQDNLERSHSSCSKIIESSFDKSLNEVEDFDIQQAMKLDEFDTNGPLFWPFEQKFNWSSELSWDFFVTSPIKNGRKFGNVEGVFTPKSNILRFDESKKHREKGLVCSPKATVPTEWKTMDVKKNLRRIGTMPSRLSNTKTQCSSKEEVTKIKNEVQELNITDPFTNRLISEYNEFLEEDFQLSYELPIEKFVGLNEFDGLEGIHRDFIEDCFLLDD